MQPQIEFNRTRFDAQLRELLKFGGSLGKDFLGPQMRLLLERIISFTPPKTVGQGNKAVARDIARAVQPFAVENFRNPRLKAIVAARDYPAWEAFARHSRNAALAGAKAAPFTAALHEQRRGARGRVTGRGLPTFVLGRPDRGELRRYAKRKIKNVGIAASGWLAALHLLGGREAGWVERHGTRYGRVTDERSHRTQPGITAINTTPWAANRAEGTRIISNAMRSRTNAMRTHLKKLLQLKARGIGLDVAA